ncbi:hypothetical protein M422DRAFT_30213, partial [Sphaerobolus stellatus SS14]
MLLSISHSSHFHIPPTSLPFIVACVLNTQPLPHSTVHIMHSPLLAFTFRPLPILESPPRPSSQLHIFNPLARAAHFPLIFCPYR